MPNPSIPSLKTHLLRLTDPRLKRRRRHELIDVLMIAVTAPLGRAVQMAQFGRAKQGVVEHVLDLPNGIPVTTPFAGC